MENERFRRSDGKITRHIRKSSAMAVGEFLISRKRYRVVYWPIDYNVIVLLACRSRSIFRRDYVTPTDRFAYDSVTGGYGLKIVIGTSRNLRITHDYLNVFAGRNAKSWRAYLRDD